MPFQELNIIWTRYVGWIFISIVLRKKWRAIRNASFLRMRVSISISDQSWLDLPIPSFMVTTLFVWNLFMHYARLIFLNTFRSQQATTDGTKNAKNIWKFSRSNNLTFKLKINVFCIGRILRKTMEYNHSGQTSCKK